MKEEVNPCSYPGQNGTGHRCIDEDLYCSIHHLYGPLFDNLNALHGCSVPVIGRREFGCILVNQADVLHRQCVLDGHMREA